MDRKKLIKPLIFIAMAATLISSPSSGIYGNEKVDFDFLTLFSKDIHQVTNSKPLKRYGAHIFFISQNEIKEKQEIIVINAPHIEIEKERQEIIVYEQNHAIYLKSLVSTGKPGIDKKGRRSSETAPGIFKVIQTSSAIPWSKDKKVIMIDAIKIGNNEKFMHALSGNEYKNYEKMLGQKASHGCVRLSKQIAKKIRTCIEKCDDWQKKPIIVYIFEKKGDSIKRFPEFEKDNNKFFLVEKMSEKQFLKNRSVKIIFKDKKEDYAVIF